MALNKNRIARIRRRRSRAEGFEFQEVLSPEVAARLLRGGFVYRIVSRVMDIVVALIGLIVFIPFFALTFIGSAISTGGSPLFTQKRLTRGARRFTIVKIRTMPPSVVPNPDRELAQVNATEFGRFLRRFKFDELPQLWNVLLGQMTLVGPRPTPPEEYSERSHHQRLLVRPGITGLAQIGRIRDKIFDLHPEYDLFYLANRSITFDLWILWRTFVVLFLGKETKIRLCARRWERSTAWRGFVPDRAMAIPSRSGPLLSTVWVLGVATLFTLLTAPAFVMVLKTKGDLERTRDDLTNAREALGRQEFAGAETALDQASAAQQNAHSNLKSPLTWGGRLLPVVSSNIQGVDDLEMAAGEAIAGARQGLKVLEDLPRKDGHLAPPWHGDTVDLPVLQKAAPAARALSDRVAAGLSRLSVPRPLLLPQVRSARRDAVEILTSVKKQSDAAVALTSVLPGLLGAEGPRTWLISAENGAELRGRGGFMGSYALLTVDHGRMSLGPFLPIRFPPVPENRDEVVPKEYLGHYVDLGALDVWQNLLMAPNYPPGAKLLLDRLDKYAGIHAEGILALDPTALSYLLEAMGPVTVPSVPEALTSKNLLEWAVNRAYFQFDDRSSERKEVLAEVAEVVWHQLLGPNAIDSTKLASALARAGRERRLVVYSSRASEQKILEQVGYAGTLDPAPGDYLMLVAQNLSENKMDYYLKRSVTYRGWLGFDGTMRANVRVKITNTSSASQPLPDYVGGARPRLGLGVNETRDYISLFVPERAELASVLVDGTYTQDFDNTEEFGKRQFGVYVQVKPGETKELEFIYEVPKVLNDGSEYVLTLQNQALVTSDAIDVDVKLSRAFGIEQRKGFLRGESLKFKGELDLDKRVLSAKLEQPAFYRLAAKLSELLHRPLNQTHRVAPSRRPSV